jgi:hypothetical protein
MSQGAIVVLDGDAVRAGGEDEEEADDRVSHGTCINEGVKLLHRARKTGVSRGE